MKITSIKKTVFFAQLVVLAIAVPAVNAQVNAVSSSPAIIYSPTGGPISAPGPVMPPTASGFIQFNNLTVDSISGTSIPAEIVASNANVYPVACSQFNGQDSAAGAPIPCPAVLAPSTSSSGSSGVAGSSGPALPTYPTYQPYRIEVSAATSLMLRDRTVATLSSFSAGDEINVFGYYNSDGSIQAYLIRDLSKPAQDQFIQLNNVELISISTSTTPATLVVTQSQGYPCYGFGVGGTEKQSIACPMGAQANTNNSALNNISVPAALAPNWEMLRKYVITVDSQTIILDSNRTTLSLSDLQAGDSLNIYGDTMDNGQTLNADIIRDLSIPAAPSTYAGKVTQVNTDGSFIIQTNDGQTITVQNPIQVGATIQLTGLLSRLTNALSQVSDIYLGGYGGGGVPTFPTPVNAPMLRVQGGSTLPAGPGGTPNTKN
jgi:hypothetical protein